MNVSESVARIISIAKDASGGKDITPMHLLYAAAADTNSLASAYLHSESITAKKVAASKPSFFADKTADQLLRMSESQSLKFDQPGVVSEALLFVLCTRCNQTKSAIDKINAGASKRLVERILNGAGISADDADSPPSGNSSSINVIKWSTTDPKTAYKNPDFNYNYNQAADDGEEEISEVKNYYGASSNYGGLPPDMLFYGQDLTEKARAGKIDNIIGRDDETNRMIEILSRKTKNNPVLIGEAGVGKSAIIEGLARRIVSGDVPEFLQNKIVFSLDIGLLMGGAKYRGELEGRLNKVLAELMKRDDIILFIDEIHNIVQSSNKEGEMGISEILKPRLARGEVRCVGATTIDEYRRYIEKDAALERRFAPIMVYAPTPEQAVQILQGLAAGFEKFHKVDIRPAAVVASVALSDRYIFDRNLPDKAIDVLDEACAKAKIKAGDNRSGIRPVITPANIAEVVSGITKIPLNKINSRDKENLLSLEDELNKAVIGQNKAISAVAKAIRRTRSGIADKNKPVGSFLFLGRTGVGKTEVCKQLANVLFDTEKAFIKLDMSEFSESHSVSKLIGSPPGYVGYEDASVLCDRVKRNPYCLVLFDEIEKAHPDIYNVLLQILDEGRLTDSHGKAVSFKNAIVVMTSNVGVNNIVAKNAIGFGTEDSAQSEEDAVMAGMKKKFSPEFINRIDSIVVFNTLTLEDVKKIAAIHLDKLTKKLAGVGVSMTYTSAAVDTVAQGGYDKEYGVRPLKRLIQTEIEDRISEQIITSDVRRISVGASNGKITVS